MGMIPLSGWGEANALFLCLLKQLMAKSHWFINPKRSEVKRFIKNDKCIDGVFEYMFVDTGKIVGVLGKEPPMMTTKVSVDIDLAREIYGRLISQGWRKTEEVLLNKES